MGWSSEKQFGYSLFFLLVTFKSFVLWLLQEPEPIDWEYYRKGIGSRLVDMYKEAYESNYLPLF